MLLSTDLKYVKPYESFGQIKTPNLQCKDLHVLQLILFPFVALHLIFKKLGPCTYVTIIITLKVDVHNVFIKVACEVESSNSMKLISFSSFSNKETEIVSVNARPVNNLSKRSTASTVSSF